MQLGEIANSLSNCQLKGNSETEITNLQIDSRKVIPGSLFAAIPGNKCDGRSFLHQAIDRGAAAIMLEKNFAPEQSPQLVVSNIRYCLAMVAEFFFANPSHTLQVVGITGTNGKTTTAFLLQHILNFSRRKCGMLGTIYYDNGRETVPAPLTTPESICFSKYLSEMVKNGCSHAVVEVSSHALSQERVSGIRFAGAIFTNLTRDHLDYHQNMDSYGNCKAKLLQALPASSFAVLNAEDSFAKKLATLSNGKVYFHGKSDDFALSVTVEQMDTEGTELVVRVDGTSKRLHSPLFGAYNVENVCGVILAALRLGVSLETTVNALQEFGGVPGRLQSIANTRGFPVFIDYAHTDKALFKVLSVLREITSERLIVVFGCGGERDRGKRSLMAKAAEANAEIVIVTSDNPRNEDPAVIFADIKAGFAKPEVVWFEQERPQAVKLALREAKSGDVVLIAGKGHEDYQIIGSQRLDMDDRVLVANALKCL